MPQTWTQVFCLELDPQNVKLNQKQQVLRSPQQVFLIVHEAISYYFQCIPITRSVNKSESKIKLPFKNLTSPG